MTTLALRAPLWLMALVCSLALGASACKRSGQRSALAAPGAPPAIAEFPTGDRHSFEDDEGHFRVELPGTPILSEESEGDPETPRLRHTAQFRDGESELLIMWNELPGASDEDGDGASDASADELLAEVLRGWAKAGLEVHANTPDRLDLLGHCDARALRGTLDKQPVVGKIAICDDTLIQIVASGTYVDEAVRVFDSFVWLPASS